MIRARYILIGAVVFLPCYAVFSVVSFFRLGSDAAALRKSAMASVSGTWNKKITLNAGGLTTGVIRFAVHHLKVGPEPRAALDSVRGAEVAVYKLHDGAPFVDHAAILAGADKTMFARGWDRIVGVSEERNLVAVYFPRRAAWGGTLKCCVLVFNGADLVVAGARGKLQPLFDLATKKLIQHQPKVDFWREFARNQDCATPCSTSASRRNPASRPGEGQSAVLARGGEFDLSIGADCNR